MEKKIKIFILEDNQDDFLLLKELLDSSDEIETEIYNSDRFENAIAIIKENFVDVAIIDLNLPDSTGIETFSQFNKHFPELPTVIMTGFKDREIAIKAVKMGAQDYLNKGESSSTAIIRTIRYAIERQRLINEINVLKGFIPICSECKKIRDDKGYWNRLEVYIQEHSDAIFSHGLCPDCEENFYGDQEWYKKMKESEKK